MMGLVHCKDYQLTHNQAPEVPFEIAGSAQLYFDADAKDAPFPIVLHMPASVFFSFLALTFDHLRDICNLYILTTEVPKLYNHYFQVQKFLGCPWRPELLC